MSLEKKIKSAYDSVHAPDALTERLKQELYQQDFREADIVGGIVEEAPRRSPVRLLWQGTAFVAASVLIFAGLGIGVRMMRDRVETFHPGTAVSAPASVTVPDVAGMSKQEACTYLSSLGFQVEVTVTDPERKVSRTEPQAGTQLPSGSRIVVICE